MNILPGVSSEGQSNQTIDNARMCYGFQAVSFCGLCRLRTTVGEIQWLGCHLKTSEPDSYPVCSAPLITEELKLSDCQTCLTEADNGGNPDDIHPDRFDHPGFPLPRPVVNVSQVELPEPTAYETIQHIENDAGPADELPSYEQTMYQNPSPPSYALTRVRDERVHRDMLTYGVCRVATHRLQGLMSVVRRRRQEIFDFRDDMPSDSILAAGLLDLTCRTMISLLTEQEETVSRIALLQTRLMSIEEDINFEGSHYPSPSEMTLLEHEQ
ncbi:hypothetical protein E4T44_04795 [Aureobasidium sp. EXF-8845]|nr:hypothetical protein E4T44_04795 [Aureobasidium sp. EXF-8845]KAI4852432.1 hypothetical protein E4T45_04705 [Aureobasidium sp. EXF-8846]